MSSRCSNRLLQLQHTWHMSRSCPSKKTGSNDFSRYNCGQSGHLSRECPDKASGMKCYNCSQPGHLSRDCKERNGTNSKMLCYNCSTVGHMARDCDKEPRERQQRGFRRGGQVQRKWGTGANNTPLGSKIDS